MNAYTIGICAAGIALLCLVGIFAIRVLWPKGSGKHVPGGRHRDTGHEGAGSPGHDEELRALRIVHTAAERRREPQPDDGEMADLFADDDAS